MATFHVVMRVSRHTTWRDLALQNTHEKCDQKHSSTTKLIKQTSVTSVRYWQTLFLGQSSSHN